MPEHVYSVTLEWTGNRGTGTSGYGRYSRDHRVTAPGRAAIEGSSDPAFRGDPARWNPEQLLLAAIATCHQLWYLHLCADAGIVVTAYTDQPEGRMREGDDGGGRFTEVLLRPRVTLAPGGDEVRALALHAEARRLCFIANSLNFPVAHQPEIVVADP